MIKTSSKGLCSITKLIYFCTANYKTAIIDNATKVQINFNKMAYS